MTHDYLVHVINAYCEEMTFRFKELHHALILFRNVKYDETVTYATVDCVEYDENDPDLFIDTQTLRVYERD